MVRESVFIHSVFIRNEVTYSKVTWYLVLNIFFILATCDNETSVELLMCLCSFVGVVSSEYLPTAVFVEDVDQLFDSFNSVKRAAPGKALRSPLSDNSPHIGIRIAQWNSGSLQSGITFNWLVYCSCLNFSKWSRQLCICKYLICGMYLFLYISNFVYVNVCMYL